MQAVASSIPRTYRHPSSRNGRRIQNTPQSRRRTQPPTHGTAPFPLAFGLLVLALLLASCVSTSEMHRRALCTLDAAPLEYVHVAYGDSLWSIAEAHNAGAVSTEDIVRWIRRKNGLVSSALSPGQTLAVPVVGPEGERA